MQWHHVADAFVHRGLIQLVPDKSGEHQFKGYFETALLRGIPEERFAETIEQILEQHVADQGLGDS